MIDFFPRAGAILTALVPVRTPAYACNVSERRIDVAAVAGRIGYMYVAGASTSVQLRQISEGRQFIIPAGQEESVCMVKHRD